MYVVLVIGSHIFKVKSSKVFWQYNSSTIADEESLTHPCFSLEERKKATFAILATHQGVMFH